MHQNARTNLVDLAVFFEKWRRHANRGSVLCAGITFALVSAVMRDGHTHARRRCLRTICPLFALPL